MRRLKFVNVINTELESLAGGFKIGGFQATNKELMQVFGRYKKYWSDKTTVNYIIMLEDGTMFTIYDYKQEAHMRPNEIINWSIGGNNREQKDKIELFIKHVLLENETRQAAEKMSISTKKELIKKISNEEAFLFLYDLINFDSRLRGRKEIKLLEYYIKNQEKKDRIIELLEYSIYLYAGRNEKQEEIDDIQKQISELKK